MVFNFSLINKLDNLLIISESTDGGNQLENMKSSVHLKISQKVFENQLRPEFRVWYSKTGCIPTEKNVMLITSNGLDFVLPEIQKALKNSSLLNYKIENIGNVQNQNLEIYDNIIVFLKQSGRIETPTDTLLTNLYKNYGSLFDFL